MACSCLDDFKKKFLADYPVYRGKSVRGVSLPEGFNMNTGKSFYYLPVYIDVGLKNSKETSLIMSHCPICGKKFEEN